MYGKGILKGLSVTWKRFWDTYIEDISWLLRGKKRYYTEEGNQAPFERRHERYLHDPVSRRKIDPTRRSTLCPISGLR